MDSVKQFSLTVCTAAILAAMLRLLMPKSVQKRGINAILLLYILSTALTLGGRIDRRSFWDTVQQPRRTQDYSAYARQLYLDSLAQTAQDALSQAGIAAQVITGEDGRCTAVVASGRLEQAEALLRALGWQGEIREAKP